MGRVYTKRAGTVRDHRPKQAKPPSVKSGKSNSPPTTIGSDIEFLLLCEEKPCVFPPGILSKRRRYLLVGIGTKPEFVSL
jgi:hypothetical protein